MAEVSTRVFHQGAFFDVDEEGPGHAALGEVLGEHLGGLARIDLRSQVEELHGSRLPRCAGAPLDRLARLDLNALLACRLIEGLSGGHGLEDGAAGLFGFLRHADAAPLLDEVELGLVFGLRELKLGRLDFLVDPVEQPLVGAEPVRVR